MRSAMNESEAMVVLTTVEQQEDAERIARSLVEQELAACVQLLPPMTSIYRWQARLERSVEILMLIKTPRAAYPALEALIKQQHPYPTPEIIALPIVAGSDDYLSWLSDSVKPQV